VKFIEPEDGVWKLLRNTRKPLTSEIPYLRRFESWSKFMRPQFSEVFMGAFENLRKAAISFIMSVCPPTWNSSAYTGRIFVILDIWIFFEILPRKFKFP